MQTQKKAILLLLLFSLNLISYTYSQDVTPNENFDVAVLEKLDLEEYDKTNILNFVEVDQITGEVKLKPNSLPILQEFLENKEQKNSFFSKLFKVLGITAIGLNSLLIVKLFDQLNKNQNVGSDTLTELQNTVEKMQQEHLKNIKKINANIAQLRESQAHGFNSANTNIDQLRTELNEQKRKLTNLKSNLTRFRNELGKEQHNPANSSTNDPKSKKNTTQQP